MPTRRWLAAIWFCFFLRALFYCAALPVWEGYDEWAHFAVVQRMAFRGELLVARDSPVPQNVAASLDLSPVSWECRNLGLAYDEFWKLPEPERTARQAAFRALPQLLSDSTGNLKTYEGLQAPLAYWLMTPLLWALGGAHLATQALLLRWFNVALLSLIVPLTFLTARAVFRREATALGCAALLAVMPGLLIGIARVSNECLAVTLFSTLLYLSVSELTRPRIIALGVVLGLGLLTKAYFLTVLPVLTIVLLWRCRRVWALWVPVLAFAISGWWYVRNLLTTGTLTGMWESAVRPSQSVSLSAVPWLRTIDSILFSHLWLGAWSTLTVRSWMYHALYALMAAAAVGLLVLFFTPSLSPRAAKLRTTPHHFLRRPRRTAANQSAANQSRDREGAVATLRRRRLSDIGLPPRGAEGRNLPQSLAILAAYYTTFWAGQLWHAALLQSVWGIATSLGCYLNAVGVAEAILCVAGLRAIIPATFRRFVAPAGVALMAIFDFYTLQMVALPYYAGFTAHRAGGGAVTAFHPATASVADFVARLAMFKPAFLPPAALVAVWVVYAVATLALVAITVRLARES